MDIRALQLHLKKQPSVSDKGQVYVISGEDLYLKTEAENLIKGYFKKVEPELDVMNYTAPQMDYEKALDAMQTLSFFSSSKLVHIKDTDKAKQKFLEDFEAFFAKGNTGGLVVVLSFNKLDKRKKVTKAILEKSTLVEVKTPYDNQVEGWVQYIAQKESLKLKKDAIAHLNFLVGPSLVEISKSVQKLKDVFGKDEVGRAEVQDFISKTGEQDIFKICDFLGKGDLTTAMLSLENSLKYGASSIGALSLFHRHFKILEGILREQQSAKGTSKRLSQKDLAAKVGVPSFFLANYIGQTRSWNLNKLKDVFKALEAADLSLKSTRLKEETVFAGFFMEISRILGERKGLRSLSESIRL